uniref:Senegalin n=1 Tax=Kassina senegalensis TaxID=8415 RepID=SENEG_KASSE|nr:RecName: Full=Senegalin; Flags: Precursor [Kassina senegalensis]CCI74234.1 sengalin precursor [Kassina senegalensis]
MLSLKKSMLLLFFLGMVSFSLANKRSDGKRADEEGEDKRADEEGEDKRADEEGEDKRKRFLPFLIPALTSLISSLG